MQKKKSIIPILLLITLCMFNCKSKKMDKKENPIIHESADVSKELYSPNKTMILTLNFKEDINPQKTFNYKVTKVKTKEEIIKGTFVGIKMEWLTNSTIKGYLFKGMIKNEKESNNSGNADSDNYKIIKVNY